MLAWLTFAGAALAADGSVGIDVASAYVWRGITLHDGPVVQPAFEVSGDWLTLGAWSNLGLAACDGCGPVGSIDEVDLALDVALPVPVVDVSVGWLEYLFPDTDYPGTREVYLAVGWSHEVVGLAADLYYDFDEIDDFYADLALTVGGDLGEDFSLEGLVRAGCAGPRMALGGQAGLHDFEARVTGGYAVTDFLSLSATAVGNPSLDPDVLPPQPVVLWAGGGVAATF